MYLPKTNFIVRHYWIAILSLLFVNSKCGNNYDVYHKSNIYPNPFTEVFTLECSYSQYPIAMKLELHGDFEGQKVFVFRDTLRYEDQKFKIMVPRSSPQQIIAVLQIGGFRQNYTLQQK